MKLFNHSLKGLQTEDGLKVANEEEVKRWLWQNGFENKPDTFYEIPGATAEVIEKHYPDANSDQETWEQAGVIVHLPKENKPESIYDLVFIPDMTNCGPTGRQFIGMSQEPIDLSGSTNQLMAELESLRTANRELKSKLEYILSEIDAIGEYHPNSNSEIEDIRKLIQKYEAK
jgi:hypothetical protein